MSMMLAFSATIACGDQPLSRSPKANMVLEELLSRDDLPAPVRALIRAEIDRSSSAAARHEHTEKALAASRLLYRDLFNSIADPIFIFDAATYHFLDVNVAALERYGYSLDELKRMVPQQLHPSKELQLVKSRLSDGDELPHDYTHVTKGGEAFPVEIHTGDVIYEGKESFISIVRDVSERLKLEEQRLGIAALQGQKLESLGVLASGLAHDLNNLLAGILGHNDLALSQLAPNHPACNNIERAMQGAEGAADLAKQMLAYSGRGQLNVLATDLSVLVKENISLLQAGLSKQVQLSTVLSEQPTFVDADAGQMQRLIMNLAINGAEAIGDRIGQVTISTGFERVIAGDDRYSRFTATDLSAGPHVFLEVRDDGDGMDEATLAKVFDPFFTT
jgi:PAS domain S-box-containing protein